MSPVGACAPRYHGGMRPAVLLFGIVVPGIVSGASGCASSRLVTPVGTTHAPYGGLPGYMVSPEQQRYDELMKKLAARRNSPGAAPIHLSAPATADVAAPATADVAPAPVNGAAAVEEAIPDQPRQGNRQAEAPNAWQPQIITPGP